MNWWIISFLELTFWVIFFPHKLVDHFFFGTYIFGSFFFLQMVDQYGALYLHYLLLLLPVGSFFLMTNWSITCLHEWSGKSWIILLGRRGRGVYGVGDP